MRLLRKFRYFDDRNVVAWYFYNDSTRIFHELFSDQENVFCVSTEDEDVVQANISEAQLVTISLLRMLHLTECYIKFQNLYKQKLKF